MVSSETCQTTINFVPIRRKREMFFDNSTICDNSDVYEDAESSLCKEPLESSVKISEKMPDISWHSRNATLDTINEEDVSRQSLDESSEISGSRGNKTTMDTGSSTDTPRNATLDTINEEDVSRQSLDESSEISEFKGNKTTMDTGSSTDTSSNWSKTEKEIQWNETSVLYNLQTSRTYESEVQIMDETVNLTTQNENIDEITKVIESKEVSQAYIQQSKDNTTLSSIVKSKNNTTLFEDSVDNIEVSPMVVHKIDSSSDSEIEIPKSQKTKKLRRVSIESSFEEDKTTFAEKAKKSPNLNKFPLHDGLDYRHVNVRRKKVLPKPIEQETSSDSENNDLNMSHGYGEQIDSDCSKKDTKRHEKLNTDSRTFSGMNVSHVFEENEDASSSSEAEIEVKKGNNLISKFKSLLNVSLSRKKKSNLFDFDNINLESAREFMDYLNDDFDCARPKNVERFFIQHGFSSRGLELSKICYDIFNTFCFNNQLPKVEINWNKRLQRTAGTTCHNTKNNTCEIKLSSKVCDRPDRIRDTLIHEMVHVANFLIDKDPKANHGPLFKKWGVTCSIMFPELPKIGTSHSYDIDAKYVYICVGCNQTIKRHRTSAIIPKRRCGICKERFQLYIDGIKA
uniref:SprT-like domain-containing protein n=1 Tax=Rhabditophanes sp. KR3021 TaxID=114890 RepID=A0AC35U870_9BILA